MDTKAGTRPGTVDGYLLADFPWYGLDEAFTGARWLGAVGSSADGTVEHGSVGHGDEPSLKADGSDPEGQRFAVVVTVAERPLRRSADGTGVLEATSVFSAAWLAGSGLLNATWPTHMDRALRQDWVEQQTSAAWELADELTAGPPAKPSDEASEESDEENGLGWSSLTLPVDGVPTPFHYRESEYGWVLAGSASGVHLGAYGRGMSAYGLALAAVPDIRAYDAASRAAAADADPAAPENPSGPADPEDPVDAGPAPARA
ncbi:hypothetical protein [Actinacidiphila yeochonensis]|uniref:hypothetical protein n=1 Tax=Actinacidiphila yeochonensis TaxID=89050 RepID=UPI000690195A|nr:hypothetical protein [Actinacidiphila yeochonensis]